MGWASPLYGRILAGPSITWAGIVALSSSRLRLPQQHGRLYVMAILGVLCTWA